MKRTASLAIAVAFALALGLFPGTGFALDAGNPGEFTAGNVGAQLRTQSFDYIDGGVSGTCEWSVYDNNGDWVLIIEPENGSYGYLESTYYDEDADGSTAPWYEYAKYLDQIMVIGYVLAGDSCSCMFCDCPNLVWADLSGLDTSETTDMSDMFFGCESLAIIWVKDLWSTESVEYSDQMFTCCYSLVGQNGTEFEEGYETALFANVDFPYDPGYLSSFYLGDATVSLGTRTCTYTGKAQKPGVTVMMGLSKLDAGEDFSVSYSTNVNVGTATATITGIGSYEGSKRTVTFKIVQAANKVTVGKASAKKTLKATALKKAAKTIALPSVSAKFGKAKWRVVSKDPKKVLSLSGNKIKVKKGVKQGAYTIKVRADVAKTSNYKAASSKVVTVKVNVK